MAIKQLLLLSIVVGSLFGSSVAATTAGEIKRYEKIQPLAFGIYTGAGVADYNFTQKIEGCDFPVSEDCRDFESDAGEVCRDPLCPGIKFSIENTCLICFTQVNNDCGCGKDDNGDYSCQYATGSSAMTSDTKLQCYIGQQNLTADVEGRVRIMKDAVEEAYEHSNKDDSVLKIFNAPEFYWRGPDGAYQLSSIYDNLEVGGFNPLNEIGRALEDIVQQDRFKDWLFIFGTVIAMNESYQDPSGNETETTYEFLNFAPIYKGFDTDITNSQGMRFLAPKRYISHIDFLSPITRNAVNNPFNDDDLYQNEQFLQLADWFQEEKDYTMIYNSFFVMNEITMSIEICLDHGNGFAKTSFVQLMNSDDFEIPVGGDGYLSRKHLQSGADVSIITSAGMSIIDDNLVLVEGGSIFLIDGLSLEGNLLETCDIGSNEDILLGYNCTDLTPSVSIHDVYPTEEEALASLDGFYSIDMSYGLPKIGVFPLVDVPTSSVSKSQTPSATTNEEVNNTVTVVDLEISPNETESFSDDPEFDGVAVSVGYLRPYQVFTTLVLVLVSFIY